MLRDLRVLALALTVIPWCTYIAGRPSTGTRATLGYLLDRSDLWGIFLVAAGVAALVWSVTPWPDFGWLAIMVACGSWAAFILLGLLFREFTWNGVGSLTVYLLFVYVAGRGFQRAETVPGCDR